MTAEEIIDLKKEALRASRDINPHRTLSKTTIGQFEKINPGVDKVLKDAETIFQWLTK